MNIKKLNNHIKIFDGAPEEVVNEKVTCSVGSINLTVDLSKLSGIDQINQSSATLDADRVSQIMGYPVVDFDGTKLYRGRKKGLDLQFLPDEKVLNRFYICSAGEYQPDRFLCFVDAVIE